MGGHQPSPGSGCTVAWPSQCHSQGRPRPHLSCQMNVGPSMKHAGNWLSGPRGGSEIVTALVPAQQLRGRAWCMAGLQQH